MNLAPRMDCEETQVVGRTLRGEETQTKRQRPQRREQLGRKSKAQGDGQQLLLLNFDIFI